jgi:CRP-like cAMP-binding protein
MRGKDNPFNFISDGEIEYLSAFFEQKSLPKGKYLWDEEILSDYLAFIISGEVELKKETEFKGGKIVLGVYTKGALLMLDLSMQKVFAEVYKDVTLLIITQKNLDKLIEVDSKLGAKLLKGMLMKISRRLERCYDRIAVFY